MMQHPSSAVGSLVEQTKWVENLQFVDVVLIFELPNESRTNFSNKKTFLRNARKTLLTTQQLSIQECQTWSFNGRDFLLALFSMRHWKHDLRGILTSSEDKKCKLRVWLNKVIRFNCHATTDDARDFDSIDGDQEHESEIRDAISLIQWI